MSINPAHTCFNGSLSAYFGKGFAVEGANQSRVVGEAVRIRYAIQYTFRILTKKVLKNYTKILIESVAGTCPLFKIGFCDHFS